MLSRQMGCLCPTFNLNFNYLTKNRSVFCCCCCCCCCEAGNAVGWSCLSFRICELAHDVADVVVAVVVSWHMDALFLSSRKMAATTY